jgi:hypothetical protein
MKAILAALLLLLLAGCDRLGSPSRDQGTKAARERNLSADDDRIVVKGSKSVGTAAGWCTPPECGIEPGLGAFTQPEEMEVGRSYVVEFVVAPDREALFDIS